jgi:hypothetical protein
MEEEAPMSTAQRSALHARLDFGEQAFAAGIPFPFHHLPPPGVSVSDKDLIDVLGPVLRHLEVLVEGLHETQFRDTLSHEQLLAGLEWLQSYTSAALTIFTRWEASTHPETAQGA